MDKKEKEQITKYCIHDAVPLIIPKEVIDAKGNPKPEYRASHLPSGGFISLTGSFYCNELCFMSCPLEG
jgi:hypothetical protein